MFNKTKDFIKRHKTKIIVGATLIGSTALCVLVGSWADKIESNAEGEEILSDLKGGLESGYKRVSIEGLMSFLEENREGKTFGIFREKGNIAEDTYSIVEDL